MHISSIIAVLLVAASSTVMSQSDQPGCSRATVTSFGAKTAYRNSKLPERAPQSTPKGCQPVQIYFIGRHGTRYPSASDVKDMIHDLPVLRDQIVAGADMKKGNLCPEDVDTFRKWNIHFNGSATNLLTKEGQAELRGIANRMRSNFPSLFMKSYTPSTYLFRSTKTPRTEASASSFAEGIFGTDKGIDYSISEETQLLRFYKTCGRWEQEVDDNETAHMEYFNFTYSREVNDMIQGVTNRLGFAEKISFHNISILYEMCRFDTAWNPGPTPSPWCNIFNNSELNLLDFADDLHYYWKDGYGYALNYEQACPVVKDLVDNFRVAAGLVNSTDGKEVPTGLFHFSHSGLLLKLYARLGLFHDRQPLLANSFLSSFNRQWKTSTIDPFGANLQFVLFDCGEDGHKVKAFVQEKEIILPNCTTSACPLDTFLGTYSVYADHCDLEAICGSSTGSSVVSLSWLLTIALTAVVVRLLFVNHHVW